jgi:hypothetical protein
MGPEPNSTCSVILSKNVSHDLRNLVGKQRRDRVSNLFVLFRSRALKKIVVGESLQASSFTGGLPGRVEVKAIN